MHEIKTSRIEGRNQKLYGNSWRFLQPRSCRNNGQKLSPHSTKTISRVNLTDMYRMLPNNSI